MLDPRLNTTSDRQADQIAAGITIGGNGVNKYPAKAHARRVAEVLRKPVGILLLEGEKQEDYSHSDQPRHFRQDRYFYYISGCNEPDCYVTYDFKKDHLTLWLPKPDSPRSIFYNGRGSTPEEALEKYDVDDAQYVDSAGQRLNLQQANIHAISQMLHPTPENPLVVLETTRTKSMHRSVSERTKFRPGFYTSVEEALNVCRAVKDEDEIALIRKANEISSKAHLEVLKGLRHLESEAEAEGHFLDVCVSAGAKEQAYGPIVGSGPNASVLHYQANNETFGDRLVLLIDASCEWQLYAADITRTMPLNPRKPGYWPSKEAEAVYKAVEKIQEACIRMMKPGVRFIDVNWLAIHMCIDALLRLGILKGEHMEIFHQGTVTAFFPHGLGHHLGLEVHDIAPTSSQAVPNAMGRRLKAYAAFAEKYAPQHRPFPGFGSKPEHLSLIPELCYKPCTVDSPTLQPGNVVTIEPGIYFNKFILDEVFLRDPEHRQFIDEDMLKRYMPVGGVRIEDDILITEKGYENLTCALKGEEMLAAIRGDN